MCGLTGFLSRTPPSGADRMSAIVDRMSKSLVHRGPDAGGQWLDADAGIALGHRRLSIIDLSIRSNQPMVDPESLEAEHPVRQAVGAD